MAKSHDALRGSQDLHVEHRTQHSRLARWTIYVGDGLREFSRQSI